MILVDTSVWVDHLRATNDVLVGWLEAGMVLTHPFVIGELAVGNMRERDVVLEALSDLPRASVATDEETLRFIAGHHLFGRGIGYVDVHLLAGARLAEADLWTNDRRLLVVAAQLGLAYTPQQPQRRHINRCGLGALTG